MYQVHFVNRLTICHHEAVTLYKKHCIYHPQNIEGV